MHWRKLGLLYSPEGSHPKLATHASNPVAVSLGGNVYRIFFSGRDLSNRSSVGRVDVDIEQKAVIHSDTRLVFEHGSNGSFFADGVSLGNIYTFHDKRYLSFMGWQRLGGRWKGNIGRLLIESDDSLRLIDESPLMSTDAEDMLSLSYPWIINGRDGRLSMWYGSTVSWDIGNGEMLHPIKYACSDDGIRWQRKGVAIPYQLGTAQAFSRPSVIYSDPERYRMWFSYRGAPGDGYRIGYAISDDGEKWGMRLDEAGITASPSGWDSEMIEYPFVFRHDGQVFMLYNGNGYGKTGFGLAILENEAA